MAEEDQREAETAQAPEEQAPQAETRSDDDANGAAVHTEQAPTLSKKKLKRLKKQEMYQEKKLQRRQAEKQKKQEIRAQRIEQSKTLTEEERQEKMERRDAVILARRQAIEEKRAKLRSALETGQKIVIDLEFADLMHEGELKSLCSQLTYLYSSNSKAEVPAHLIFTGLQGVMQKVTEKQISGLDKWLITSSGGSYMDHFAGSTDQLVYLTADSDYELQELNPTKVYIIGGLVDRNRHKGICYKKATEQGIATARLPIGEYLELTSSKVMCTNHVVDIMLKWLEVKDWEQAFKSVVPIRKRKAEDEEEGAAAADEAAAGSGD